jgi:hypothetical protein
MPSLCKLAYAAHSLIIAVATSYYVQHIYSHITKILAWYLIMPEAAYLLHVSMYVTL